MITSHSLTAWLINLTKGLRKKDSVSNLQQEECMSSLSEDGLFYT